MKLRIGNKATPFLSEKMFGLFFEDINYAADGGLYAEMIENRQFAFRRSVYGLAEKTYDSIYAGNYGWQTEPGTDARMIFRATGGLNDQNPHHMRFMVGGEKASFTNKAYDGIYMKQGAVYQLTMWVRSAEYEENITVKVVDQDGTEICSTECKVKGEGQNAEKAADSWQLVRTDLIAGKDVKKGIFTVSQKKGCVDYGYISLMPEDAVCGVYRKDLFELLQEMHPGFLRFPGGCIVEGADLDNRYRWKDTVGLPWERKWNWSRWAVHDVTMGQGEPLFYPFYNQSYGIGFYEYFLLSELLGAKALPVLSVGLACQFQSEELVPIADPAFQEYLQDALDLIEFANGDATTKWGKVRAQMGHPEPFGLEYIGIGNEQWETEKVDFFARYKAFEEAIHAVHPEILLLGSAGPDVTTDKYTRAWEFYRKECAQNPKFTAAVDEHYYMPPAWFYEHVDMYDDYSREIPVFAGEYAAHCEKKQNNWEAGMAEAAFMCGLERNGDVIRFASAAPLFAREGYAQWKPDYIWFDGETSMGTPGYYVQKAFGTYTGYEGLDYTLECEGEKQYCAVSRDDKAIYIKIVNAEDKMAELTQLSVEDKEIRWSAAKLYQMSAEDLTCENHLQGKQPLVLTEKTADEKGVRLPAYSFTVIILPIA